MWRVYRSAEVGSGEANVIALKDIDLTIGHGELVAIDGGWDRGSRRCSNILGCLDRPTWGAISSMARNVASHRVADLREIREIELGFVFQLFHLLPKVTGLDNVALPLVYAKVRRSERRRRARRSSSVWTSRAASTTGRTSSRGDRASGWP